MQLPIFSGIHTSDNLKLRRALTNKRLARMFSPIFIITQQLLFWLSHVIFALPRPDLSQSKKNNGVSIVEHDGRNFTIFEHAATGVKLDFVTNSRICETTPGVNQYSGYISLGPNQYTWFWL